MRPNLKLFEKITAIEFSTDYSTGGFLYPPLFVWPKIGNYQKIKKKIKEVIRDSNIDLGLYVHFPFCLRKCSFCRFFSSENKNPAEYERFLNYLTKELKIWAELIKSAGRFKKNPLESVYLGGGTPTLFDLEKFFDALKEDFDIKNCRQINLESTLDALDEKKLRFYKKAGVGRLLLGVQSLDPEVLKKSGRFSGQARILEKVYFSARKIGLPAVTFELICGLPGQSKKSFFKDLERLVALGPDGIHIYAFLKTPLSAIGRKIPANGRSRASFSFSGEQLLRQGAEFLRKNGYVNVGDEWIRGQTQKARNLQNSSRTQSVIPVGPSAIGNFKKNDFNLRLFNTTDLVGYAESIEAGRLPLAKYFQLKGGELTRSQMATLMNRPAIDRRFVSGEFKREVAWLKRRNLLEEKEGFFRFKFPTYLEKFIYSKIFYSPEIIRACREFVG